MPSPLRFRLSQIGLATASMLALATTMATSGCPSSSDPTDARAEVDTGVVREACTMERSLQCGSPARHCCDGFIREFYDGVCMPRRDAGDQPDAGDVCGASYGVAGCACATEGSEDCGRRGAFGYDQWLLRCEGGRWVEQTGFMCC